MLTAVPAPVSSNRHFYSICCGPEQMEEPYMCQLLRGGNWYYTHFTDGENKAVRGKVTQRIQAQAVWP